MDDAVDGDCILITPGTYAESVNIGALRLFIESEDIDDDLTVASTIITGSNTRATCIVTDGGVTQDSWIRGLTITAATDHGIQAGTENSPANVFVSRCRFIDNGSLTNGEDGAGLAYTNGNVQDCSFRGNQTEGKGAGMYSGGGAIISCIFVDNEAGENGGALAKAGSVDKCEFYDNVADNGGALSNSPSVLVTNCVFAKNDADTHGGAVYKCLKGKFYNNTFVLNTADNRGGAMREVKNSGAKIKSNIFFLNSTGSGNNPDTSDCATRHFCWFEASKAPSSGNNNVDDELSPLLVFVPITGSGENGNYHLTANSGCRGTGRDLDGSNNDTPNNHDFEGQTRPRGGDGWDIGADEH